MLWIFQLPEKSSDFSRGTNPRTRVPEASMLTTTPPKPQRTIKQLHHLTHPNRDSTLAHCIFN
jgi:hypothetical protein